MAVIDDTGLESLLGADAGPGRLHVQKRLGPGAGYEVALDATPADPQTNDTDVSSRFVISTADEDREKDVILPRGILLDTYRLNPVVLWMHGATPHYPFPLGKSESPDGRLEIERGDYRAHGTCWYDQKSAFAMQVYDLVRRGFIRGASVRVLPAAGEVEQLGPRKGDHRGPILIKSGQLIEWSICPIGVNPYALKAELGNKALMPELVKCLAPFAAVRKSPTETGGWDGAGKAFDESKHPRGQPENRGQFGPGGGATGAQTSGAPSPLGKLVRNAEGHLAVAEHKKKDSAKEGGEPQPEDRPEDVMRPVDRQVAAELVAQMLKGGREHAVLLDADGKEIAHAAGDEAGVEIEHAALYDPKAQLTYHHTHPEFASLSAGDFRALASQPGVKTMYAHLPDGSSHAASILPGKHDEVKTTATELYEKVRLASIDAYIGDTSPDNAEKRVKYRGIILRESFSIPPKLAAMGLIEYRATPATQGKAIRGEVGKSYDASKSFDPADPPARVPRGRPGGGRFAPDLDNLARVYQHVYESAMHLTDEQIKDGLRELERLTLGQLVRVARLVGIAARLPNRKTALDRLVRRVKQRQETAQRVWLGKEEEKEKAFDESKHKRGQPENRGQFGPGGGGASSAQAGGAPAPLGKLERNANGRLAVVEHGTSGTDAEVSVDPKTLTAGDLFDGAETRYPKAPDIVDGRQVVRKVANRSSIDSTLDDYEELPGIREVRMDEFQTIRERRAKGAGEVERRSPADDERRVEDLAAKIKESNTISALIVVDDGHPDGPYVLEGGHRFDALERLGAKAFPAKVVLDLRGIGDRVRAGKLTARLLPNTRAADDLAQRAGAVEDKEKALAGPGGKKMAIRDDMVLAGVFFPADKFTLAAANAFAAGQGLTLLPPVQTGEDGVRFKCAADDEHAAGDPVEEVDESGVHLTYYKTLEPPTDPPKPEVPPVDVAKADPPPPTPSDPPAEVVKADPPPDPKVVEQPDDGWDEFVKELRAKAMTPNEIRKALGTVSDTAGGSLNGKGKEIEKMDDGDFHKYMSAAREKAEDARDWMGEHMQEDNLSKTQRAACAHHYKGMTECCGHLSRLHRAGPRAGDETVTKALTPEVKPAAEPVVVPAAKPAPSPEVAARLAKIEENQKKIERETYRVLGGKPRV